LIIAKEEIGLEKGCRVFAEVVRANVKNLFSLMMKDITREFRQELFAKTEQHETTSSI
jgi:hypothetical protein